MSCLPGCTPQVTASINTHTFTPVQPGFRLLKGYYSAGALFLDVPIVGFVDGAWPVDDAGVVYDRAENAKADEEGYIYAVERPGGNVVGIRWENGTMGGMFSLGYNGEWINREVFLQGLDNAPPREDHVLNLTIAEESIYEEVTSRYAIGEHIDIPTVALAAGFSQTVTSAALVGLAQKSLVNSNITLTQYWRKQ